MLFMEEVAVFYFEHLVMVRLSASVRIQLGQAASLEVSHCRSTRTCCAINDGLLSSQALHVRVDVWFKGHEMLLLLSRSKIMLMS